MRCAVCKGLVPASKQFLLSSTPPILALQLKRFGYGRYGSGKISSASLARRSTWRMLPECRKQHSNRYRLYGVLVHQGSSVHGGHYYCHVRAASGVWHRCDDDRVAVVSVNKVLSECAYMLFLSGSTTAGHGQRRAPPQPPPARAPPMRMTRQAPRVAAASTAC